MSHVRLQLAALAAATLACSLACSGRLDSPIDASAPSDAAVVSDDAALITVDTSSVVAGVADQGRDPAVVAINVNHVRLCTGTLIATNVVLTARHCVSDPRTFTCPAEGNQVTTNLAPASLGIMLGDVVVNGAQAVAHGAEVVVPLTGELCDHDIAAIILDEELDVAPVKVSAVGAKSGHFVRTVGFAMPPSGDAGAPFERVLREYVRIADVSPTEFEVGEATCTGDSGGPAFDESSSELLGVVSRSGSYCEGPDVHNIYTRADVYSGLIAAAVQEGATLNAAAGLPKQKKPVATKPASDVGDPCQSASDCSTGLCVETPESAYCSRTCDSSDRCPDGFRCTAEAAQKVCIEK